MELSKIGPFSIEENLDPQQRGGVFRGIHLERRQSFALKVQDAPLIAKNQELRRDFAGEVKLLKQLDHPNIVSCYGGGVDGGRVYLVYELVRGESLAERMKRRGRLTWEEAVEIALQITAALEHAHGQGFLHLDLTPDKILLDEQESLRVSDFRSDRLGSPLCAKSRKRSLPRVAYLPPEMIAAAVRPGLDERADLYSLGCILFEVLTGRPPFVAESAEGTARMQMTEPPPRVSTLSFDVPVWLDHLVAGLLHKDPAQRPYGAAAVRLALAEAQKRVSAGTGVTEHAAAGFSPLAVGVNKTEARRVLGRDEEAAERSGKPIHERPWFWALCFVVLLPFPIAILIWVLQPPSDDVMMAQAQLLMRSGSSNDRRAAKEQYLEPLIERDPDGPYAGRAQELIDEIDRKNAEQRIRLMVRVGLKPETEAERICAEAREAEQLGEPELAVEKYQSVVDLFDAEGKDRPYVLLARHKLEEIRSEATRSGEDAKELLDERLAEAERRFDEGRTEDARRIWRGIALLYGTNKKLAEQVQRAENRLEETKPDKMEIEPPISPTDD